MQIARGHDFSSRTYSSDRGQLACSGYRIFECDIRVEFDCAKTTCRGYSSAQVSLARRYYCWKDLLDGTSIKMLESNIGVVKRYGVRYKHADITRHRGTSDRERRVDPTVIARRANPVQRKVELAVTVLGDVTRPSTTVTFRNFIHDRKPCGEGV